MYIADVPKIPFCVVGRELAPPEGCKPQVLYDLGETSHAIAKNSTIAFPGNQEESLTKSGEKSLFYWQN